MRNTLLDNEDFGCDGAIVLMATVVVCLHFDRGSSHTGWDSPSVADFYISGKYNTILQDPRSDVWYSIVYF